MIKNIDDRIVQELRQLYGEDEVAHAFLDAAARRQNDVAETTIDRIAQMAGSERPDAIRLARQLEEMQCGRLLVGRKGWKTRFSWEYSLPTLGRAARGEETELRPVNKEAAEDAADQQAVVATAETASSEVSISGARFTIADAKQRLADTYGTSADKIEIIIRG